MSQEWSLTQGAQPVKRKGKAAIITGIVLIVLALVAGIAGIAGIASGVGSIASESTEPFAAPNTITVSLESGKTYVVYELEAAAGQGSMQISDITVTDPSGATVPVTGMGSFGQGFNEGADSFVAVGEFVTSTTGTYTIDVTTEGTTFMVGPSLGSFIGLGLSGLAIVLAALLGIAGVIVLIIGLVRRASSKPAAVGTGYPAGAVTAQPYVAPAQAPQPQIFEQPASEQAPVQPFVTPAPAAPVAPAPAAALPPAGWYPDPGRPGGQRYWDGQQWTEHQA
ncbi:DUF2510 domain-containing protein [Longivirga aurantiaca]|uniref:DUF2510 domain-containing protein n=1 Tax=Longivirga aurantiaca TaxID=1837743 RepID=A0ABW1SY87_9ACTN